jgi:threonine dehydrogenase-like Zn-dependent dehydrogenase
LNQLLQHLSDGTTEIAQVPVPHVRAGHLLIQTHRTLISAGTERMLVEFGKANMIEKARQQPDKVRMVLDKVKADGFLSTLDAVRSKLEMPLVLGYCNVGTVIEVGSGVTEFSVGDRVVSNGPHAEIVCVAKNLCARVPDRVADDEAVFTVVASVGLQGIRLAQPTLGESFVVSGLGLIGLITVQLLRAHGCRVFGIDPSPERVALARSFGVEAVCLGEVDDPVSAALLFSRGRGVDGVIITASTKSSEPVQQAAKMCRKRGRIVMVGVTGLELSRADFYEKELSFQVSCSYGPGRYDPEYEEKGHDYPIGFVRWTEQRNFEAVLDMMASGQMNVMPLISHRFPIERAVEAYELLAGKGSSLGIVLEYGNSKNALTAEDRRITLNTSSATSINGMMPKVSFIGAGNYAGRTLIPVFRNAGASLRMVASNGGVSGTYFGRKYGFDVATMEFGNLSKLRGFHSLITIGFPPGPSLVRKSPCAMFLAIINSALAITDGFGLRLCFLSCLR